MHLQRAFLVRLLPVFLAVWIALCAGNDNFYAKVPNIFMDNLEKCSLKEIDAHHKLMCLNACSRHSECELACYGASTSKCRLYEALVTRFWNPQVSEYTMTLDGFECYTSWVKSNEITDRAIAMKSSPELKEIQGTKYAIDGYYCAAPYYYHSRKGGKYYEIELEKVSKISKIVVKTRKTTASTLTHFVVNIGVGNFSGEGDYSGYTHFGHNENMPAGGEIVTVKSPHPLYGKYIGIESQPGPDYLIIGEIKIIS